MFIFFICTYKQIKRKLKIFYCYSDSKIFSEYWEKKMVEYRSWMETEDQLGTDESRRPGKPKTAEVMFGVEGSFRKLELD